MKITYLLDTNVLSTAFRATPGDPVLDRMAAASGRMAIASITWHELVFGASRLPPSKRRDRIETFLQSVVLPNFPIYEYEKEAAEWHAKERARLQQIGVPTAFADGQIAAIAMTRELVLVTNNTKDASMFQGILLEDWSVRATLGLIHS